jgi:hypothetical protein
MEMVLKLRVIKQILVMVLELGVTAMEMVHKLRVIIQILMMVLNIGVLVL